MLDTQQIDTSEHLHANSFYNKILFWESYDQNPMLVKVAQNCAAWTDKLHKNHVKTSYANDTKPNRS